MEVAAIDPHQSGSATHAVLALAAAAEQNSEHPLGNAILAAAQERDLDIPSATGFRSTPGKGVIATADGRHVRVGSPHLLDTLLDSLPITQARRSADALIDRMESDGRTAVVVLVDDVPVIVIALADRPRPQLRETMAALTGHPPVLLTGANPRAAASSPPRSAPRWAQRAPTSHWRLPTRSSCATT